MGLQFAQPLALTLLGLVALAFYLRRRTPFSARSFARFPLAEDLPRSLRQRLLPLLPILEALAAIAIVLALAGPYQLRQIPKRQKGIDILLCIDTSSSMSAKDMDPKKTRLRIAKDAAKEFAITRRNDRIGLLRFSRYPDLLCPPTLDHVALNQWIEGMRVVQPDGDEDLTGIGAALARGALVLGKNQGPPRSKAEPTPKVIILLTDGRETVAVQGSTGEIHPRQASLLCKRYGIRVHTIAVGRKKKGRGQSRKPYDLAMLQSIASSSGGATFEAQDTLALTSIYNRIDQLETSNKDRPLLDRSEKFRPFLLAALLLLVTRILLGATYLEVHR